MFEVRCTADTEADSENKQAGEAVLTQLFIRKETTSCIALNVEWFRICFSHFANILRNFTSLNNA